MLINIRDRAQKYWECNHSYLVRIVYAVVVFILMAFVISIANTIDTTVDNEGVISNQNIRFSITICSLFIGGCALISLG